MAPDGVGSSPMDDEGETSELLMEFGEVADCDVMCTVSIVFVVCVLPPVEVTEDDAFVNLGPEAAGPFDLVDSEETTP